MFKTIIEHTTSEIVEKKSKFIANIYHIENEEQANTKIKEIKKKYFDARHNCIAYRVIEDGKIIERFSDDGEPSGTAGSPMLNILQKNDLCNILVVVTRYFGGILLGTGGLVRAYSEATIQGIEKADKINVYQGMEYKLKLEYSELENLKYYCRKNSINITNIEYLNEINCNIQVKEEDTNKLKKDIEEKRINILEFEQIKEVLMEVKQ